MRMKAVLLAALAAVFVAGCASTVESRKKERVSAYSQLDSEAQTLVDQGRIKIGMPMDAVYIAWGKPSQVVQSESPDGHTVTWIYHGTYYQEYPYWSYGPHFHHHGYYPYFYSSPVMDYGYIPRDYVRGQVTFQDGLVTQWRTLPRAGY